MNWVIGALFLGRFRRFFSSPRHPAWLLVQISLLLHGLWEWFLRG